MKYLPEIIGYLSWIATIVISYHLTIFVVKKFDKKQATVEQEHDMA